MVLRGMVLCGLAGCGGGTIVQTGPEGGGAPTFPPLVTDDGWWVVGSLDAGPDVVLYEILTGDIYGSDLGFATTWYWAGNVTEEGPAGLPAIGDDGFVFADTRTGLHVLTPTLGRWFDVTSSIATGVGLLHDGGFVYGGLGERLAVHEANGDLRWDLALQGVPYEQPLIGRDDAIFVLVDVGGSADLVALEPDGRVRFRFDVEVPTGPVALVGDAAVLVASAPTFEATSSTVRAFDPVTGEALWAVGVDGAVRQLVAWGNGDIGVLIGDEDGEVVVLDGGDGDERGRTGPFGQASYGTIGSDQRLYTGCGPALCAVDRQGRIDEIIDTDGDLVYGWPLLYDGILFAQTDSGLVRWTLTEPLWTATEGWPRPDGDNRGTGRAP